MDREWHSPEQVAERLGLHVRTVRGYIRDGRLRAVRIGKQYRIGRADLDAFIGRPAPRRPRAEVSAVIEIADVDQMTADRLSTLVVAGAQTGGGFSTVRAVHDVERARLKVIVVGGVSAASDVLRTLDAVLGEDEGGEGERAGGGAKDGDGDGDGGREGGGEGKTDGGERDSHG